MATLNAPMGEVLQLRQGGRLGFAQFGDPEGKPIFFFHGGGDSRLTRHPDDSIARSLGIRLLTVDRPGVGLSDVDPGTFLDWTDHVLELADALELDHFAVFGHSSGGPYAVACAYKLAPRLTAAGVVAGIGPLDYPGAARGMRRDFRVLLRIAPFMPGWVARLIGASMARRCDRDPESFFEKQFGKTFPACDRKIIDIPEVRANIIAGMIESFRQRGAGLVQEGLLLARSWVFPLEEIKVPVFLWYGSADTFVPRYMGEHLSRSIPGANLTIYEDEGHMIVMSHWAEILTTLSRTLEVRAPL